MSNGDIKGFVIWFLYACVPPLFFFGWWLWRRHVERPGYCSWCKRWHMRGDPDDC